MTDWRDFLDRRGVELTQLQPVAGGVINETWLVNDNEYVLRKPRPISDSYSAQGFPDLVSKPGWRDYGGYR